jgi:hypothetical protein
VTSEVGSSDDHTLRTIDPPRELDAWERRVIERIVSWPETDAILHRAVEGIRVRAECTQCAAVYLTGEGTETLRGPDGEPSYAVFPGELWLGEGGACVHVLIHIAEGRVDELQVYRDDGAPEPDRPNVDAMHLTSSWTTTHDAIQE